jgi:FKBP-type peptidyl-prolyl cis-trans isomerase
MRITLNATLLFALLSLCSGYVPAADNFQLTARGAHYKDLKEGTGEIAEVGDVATIHFIGWLDNHGANGKEIFNTRKEGVPVSFVVGTEKVMPGWNDCVIGMRQGGKRLLMLPPALGYGAKGVQEIIPPNAKLIFVIDLDQLNKFQK